MNRSRKFQGEQLFKGEYGRDFQPAYDMPYSREETSGLYIFASFVGLAIVISIIFTILYFTCTTPFGTINDKCKCKSSNGTWKTVDGEDVCKCPTTLDLVDGVCLKPCKPGETRDSDTLKCIPPVGTEPNPNPNPNPNPITCTSTQELYAGMCVAKCAPGQIRVGGVCRRGDQCAYQDIKDGKCIVTCPDGSVSNGITCVYHDPLSWFKKLSNQAIAGFNKESYQATTEKECANLCLNRSWCNSVDFNHVNNSCFLQDNPNSTATYPTTDWDNYARN